MRDFPKIKDQRPNDETDRWVDCKTVGIFFLQIAKRRHSVRVSHEAREPHTPYGRPFSASLQTFSLFDVTVRAYLATRKYGLACVCSLSSGSAYHIILSF